MQQEPVFITSGGNDHNKAKQITLDCPHADEIGFTYTKIHSTLDNINSRIKNVIDTNQGAFIGAYKETMDGVRGEIKTMKQKLSSEKLKQKG
jgi:uncharacterized protein YukE